MSTSEQARAALRAAGAIDASIEPASDAFAATPAAAGARSDA